MLVRHTYRLWEFMERATVGCMSTQSSKVRLGARGRLVLPRSIREDLRLREGDDVLFVVEDDGTVRITSRAQMARHMRGMFKDRFPGRSGVDELIAERRAEARREDDEQR